MAADRVTRRAAPRNASLAVLLAAALAPTAVFPAQAPPNVAERLGHPRDARLLVIHADGARWRQADFDLVRSAEFQQFLRDEKFVLVSWRDLARALP